MRKILLTSVPATVVALFLVTACAEESTDTNTTAAATSATEAVATETAAAPNAATQSIMDQPVDFTSPESVEQTLQAIRQQAGEGKANSVNNALGYLLVYDLSVNRNKNKLYQKLDGKTPNEIITMMGR